MTDLRGEARTEKLARFDVRTLREISSKFRHKSTPAELFHIYLLTLMGRMMLRRAAVYIPTADAGKSRLFLHKGHAAGELPETIELLQIPPNRRWMSLSDILSESSQAEIEAAGFSNLHAIRWKDSAGATRGAGVTIQDSALSILVITGSDRMIEPNQADEQFLDLLGRQAEETLERHMGDMLRRLVDLGRRSDLARGEGRQSTVGRRTREALLDTRNFQTLQDIAFRFKSGSSLFDLFNTYLLTIMGRLRLKRAAIYAATLPSNCFRMFLLKGRPERGSMPDIIEVDEMPKNQLWVNIKDHRELNRGNILGRQGYSLAWILSRETDTPDGRQTRADALVYMGRDEDIRLEAADIKFIEILNHQIVGMLNMLDSFNARESGTLWDWDSNLSTLIQDTPADQCARKEHLQRRVLFRPAHRVGGDFYDFHDLRDGRQAVVLADVVGHGIPAAIWTYAIREQLQKIATSDDHDRASRPADVLENLNAVLLKNQKSEIPVSVFYGVFDPRDWSFTYSSAGIDYPLLLRAQDAKVFELPAGGLFLGCVPNIRFSEETIYLEPDDLLILYTDGCESAVLGGGWRETALQHIRRGPCGRPVLDLLHELLLGAIDARPQEDDCTAILISPPAEIAARREQPEPDLRTLTIPSDVRHLPTLRVFIDNVIRRLDGLSTEDAFAVEFTVEDAAVNSIQHGYEGRPDGSVTIEARREPDRLVLTITDRGRGFRYDIDRIPRFESDQDLYRSNGRGLFMMRQFMDDVDIQSTPGGGTVVRLVKRLIQRPPQRARRAPEETGHAI